jgi:heptosyltransferase-2
MQSAIRIGGSRQVPSRHLIVRLPNWVGEATLTLPTLSRLHEAGFQLHLFGKPWAADLFAGHHWGIHTRADSVGRAVAQLVALRERLSAMDPDFERRINMLLFPKSHSSALEARLAGLRAVGYACDWRSYLLRRRVRYEPREHAVDAYWRLGACLTTPAPTPHCAHARLNLSPAQNAEARRLIHASKISGPYAVLCPFSGSGDGDGQKRWPGFPEFSECLASRGIKPIVCPGRHEVDQARAWYPTAAILTDVSLGVYAALMRDSWCTIANDTGPGHLAAAAGATLVSVLGPSFIERWTPRGPEVTCVRYASRWPTLDEVFGALPLRTHRQRVR